MKKPHQYFQTNMACVIFLHCNHNAVCGPCFEKVRVAHVTKEFAGDRRQIERKEKRNQHLIQLIFMQIRIVVNDLF